MTNGEIWTLTRNGKSHKALWQNVEPEIKALLSDDGEAIKDGAEVDFRGFHYKAVANFYGKDYVFRTDGETGKSQPTETQTETVVDITNDVASDKSLPHLEPIVTTTPTLLPSLNSSKYEDIQAVKIKDIKEWLEKGYIPLGNTWAEMYKDGLVGLGKPRS